MPINPIQHYQQVLSMALEDRSKGYQDLVSNSNALLAVLKRKGNWKSYSGPRIRETLQIAKPSGQWYSGYDVLANAPVELFNDAYFTPKMVAVPISLAYEEILNNEGPNQIMDVMEAYIDAAERALEDTIETALYSDGTDSNGKALGGLNLAVPILNTQGVYGGIDRAANPIWQTGSYDANSGSVLGVSTAGGGATTPGINAANIRQVLNAIMIKHSRGSRGADLLLMSPEHYAAYDAATTAIQRITDDSKMGKLGFTSLKYYGPGRVADIVLAGGINSSMPANTTFGLETDSLRMRYNPSRNFNKLFEGEGMKPINQDAIVQYIGFMGELTMTNPLFTWRLRDSVTP